MRKLYHVCLSSGNEVMFRSESDYVRGFNCLAVALHRTSSSLLADSFMSNHFHICVESSDVRELMFRYRAAYSRYFNSKYFRRGPLGEKCPFVIDVVGVYHRLAALSYTFRNALHHGVAPTPFAYRHNSANAIFRTELGKFVDEELLPREAYYRYLPDKADVPSGYRMNKSGLLLRESVVDVSQVEFIYGSPRNFLFYMNRLSGEEWEREQQKENGPAISLGSIELGSKMNDVSAMLSNEHGRGNYNAMSDVDLCQLIDGKYLHSYGVRSVYELDLKSKQNIANELWRELHIGRDKIERCLVLP